MNEAVTKLYQEGVSYRTIAKRLDLSIGQVAGIIRRLGIAKKIDTSRCFNASKDKKAVVFESSHKYEQPKQPSPSPYYSPKQRALYEELRKAVENTNGK